MSSEQGIIKHPRQMVPQESPVFMTKAQRRQKKQSEPTLDQLLVREEMGWGTLTEKEEKRAAVVERLCKPPPLDKAWRMQEPRPVSSRSGYTSRAQDVPSDHWDALEKTVATYIASQRKAAA